METLQVMKRIKYALIFFIIIQSCDSTKKNKFDCTDKFACQEVEKNLEILSDFIFYGKTFSGKELNDARSLFENLSGYKSDADVQFEGQSPPTLNDFYTWTSWYSTEYNRLRYNKEKKQIYLISE
ncbi:hypothetical protein [uncultured Psychroserpens sp.]|uniref:hypothetical protein n=1 Tax=uncultured Psychroserpens sp. TaxID=255436 RepID=UPI00262EC7FF|nr:hypothetical protein [uncultured Psychroserpens sp.]